MRGTCITEQTEMSATTQTNAAVVSTVTIGRRSVVGLERSSEAWRERFWLTIRRIKEMELREREACVAK